MTHPIDFNKIEEEIFIIQNFCHASETFGAILKKKTERNTINNQEFISNWERTYYFEWLKGLLSEKLFYISTKIRTIFDIILNAEKCGDPDEWWPNLDENKTVIESNVNTQLASSMSTH
ncbi:MAG: hypothetical protein VW378_07435 [bacterium]